jgi:hypothetical protein
MEVTRTVVNGEHLRWGNMNLSMWKNSPT